MSIWKTEAREIERYRAERDSRLLGDSAEIGLEAVKVLRMGIRKIREKLESQDPDEVTDGLRRLGVVARVYGIALSKVGPAEDDSVNRWRELVEELGLGAGIVPPAERIRMPDQERSR